MLFAVRFWRAVFRSVCWFGSRVRGGWLVWLWDSFFFGVRGSFGDEVGVFIFFFRLWRFWKFRVVVIVGFIFVIYFWFLGGVFVWRLD